MPAIQNAYLVIRQGEQKGIISARQAKIFHWGCASFSKFKRSLDRKMKHHLVEN
jgi:hypothetical protein